MYPQRRWGKNKKTIGVYKFRTMVVDADKKFGRTQAHQNDPRITRVGKFLRATSVVSHAVGTLSNTTVS